MITKQTNKFNISKINTLHIIIIILTIIIIILVKPWILYNQIVNSKPKWHSVQLINNEIYYGEIKNIKSDPIKLQNTYYNYKNKNINNKKNTNTNLQLVKRGQETHGPNGTMYIPSSQILYIEKLHTSSKVLKAIISDTLN